MKKIIAIFLLVASAGTLFAQQQPAGAEPRDSQPIVVGGENAGPQSTTTVRTVTTKKAYTATTTIPETTTTVTAPDRVLVREGLLSWLSVGLRASVDYHLTPKDGSLSCLWFFGEWYNTAWGLQAGVGYLWMPVTTYADNLNRVTYNGVGTRSYVTFDFIGKYYWWFARSWWLGAGMNYAALLGGQLKWDATGAPASGTNPADAAAGQVQYARWADIAPGGGLFYVQVGTGLRIALGNAFNVVNFEPEFRALIPLNPSTGNGTVLRFNMGFSYAFGL